MDDLVKERRVIGLGRCRCGRVDEASIDWHINAIERRNIACSVAACPDGGPCGRDKSVRAFDFGCKVWRSPEGFDLDNIVGKPVDPG